MDWLSRIVAWLSDHEAAISALAAIIVIGGVVLAGLRLLVRRRGETAQETAPAAATEPTPAAEASAPDLDPLTVPGFEGRSAIAVLPFDNLSGDPEQAYFADGIAEDLITRLSAWRSFPVIARNSSFIYKGKPVDVKQVSRELGVRYVVEGSVRKAGDRVRISVQLIDARTGSHVWADTYDRELRDIFELQDEITHAVVGAMHPELKRSEMRRVVREEPKNLDAWDCVMRGWWHRSQFTKEDNLAAQRCFKQAIELDPQSSEAFASLAYLHTSQILQQWTDDMQKSIADLTQAARRSVELDPSNPSAQLVRSIAARFNGRTEEMIEASRQALELNPSDWRAYADLAVSLGQTGAAEEALEYVEKGMRLSPRDPMIFMLLQNASLACIGAERYKEAVDWARQSVHAFPGIPTNWRILASACAHLGQLDEARSAFQEMLRLSPEYSVETTKAALSAADPKFRERYIDGLRKAGMEE